MSIDCSTYEYLHPTCDPWNFWTCIFSIIAMVAISAILAGMLMGYMSLDKLNVLIMTMEGNEVEKEQAKTVLPLVNQSHRVLVSLLLINYVGLEALPIWLNRLVPEATAIFISVTFVLFFREILPSAIFTGKHQMAIAAALAPCCQGIMLITCPISYPLAKGLDKWMGDGTDIARYRRNELKALISLQQKQVQFSPSNVEFRSTITSTECTSLSIWNSSPSSVSSTDLLDDEVTIINSALDMSTKKVEDIMTPFNEVYMLNDRCQLDRSLMAEILASGYSRIPVYHHHRSNIRGIPLVKRLIVVDPRANKTLKDLVLRKPHVVPPAYHCYTMLKEFQRGKGHFALLSENSAYVQACWDADLPIDPLHAKFLGIVTNEDVLEELIQNDIQDESDRRDIHLRSIVSDSHRIRQQEAGMKRAIVMFQTMAARARARIAAKRCYGESGSLEESIPLLSSRICL